MKRVNEFYYEELGEKFDEFMSSYDVARRIRLIKEFLPAGADKMVTLEVGCGTGKISEELRPDLGRLTVSDISETLAEKVGERLSVEWRGADACRLPFGSGADFDLVVSSECIEHTPDPRQALREMVRVLRPGGYVLVTSPNKLWYPVLVISMLLKIRKFQGNELWLWPWTAARVLKDANCTIVARGGCHLFPWQFPGAQLILPVFDRLHRLLHPFMINWCVLARKSG